MIALAALCSCDRNQDKTGPKSLQPPTATEVFNLRSKCAELARRAIDDSGEINPYAPYHTSLYLRDRTLVSRYDSGSNRCYVLIEGKDWGLKSRYLFDGQTDELLAETGHTSLDKQPYG
jgi:hypothetical protein